MPATAREVAPAKAAAPAVATSATPASVSLRRSALVMAAPPQVRLRPGPSSDGQPLATEVRAPLEHSLGADLSAVRVRTDGAAQTAADRLGARAFTYGTQIFLRGGESPRDLALIGHETAHVLQQQGGAAVQQWSLLGGRFDSFEAEAHAASGAVSSGRPFLVRERTAGPQVQRLGISDALNRFAEYANNIPGFRMFTIVLGVNPINMRSVERSAANILRAVVEFMPGGALITQALDNHGVFDRVGAWVEEQIRTLGLTGATIRQAVMDFLNGLSFSDIFDLGGVWERAKRIFTDPITRIKNFVVGLVSGVLRFIREAVLRPLARLAEGTRGYDLLKAVLGEDPVTGEPVPRNAETLIGGFMKLINQEEIWNNLKRANAVARAWAWFQGALEGLMGFVRQIPRMFVQALQSLEIADLVLVPRAFARIVSVFGDFAGRFFSWAGAQVMKLLEIIFEVVAPGAMTYIRRAAGAFRSIIENPIGFVGNLVRAGILGFRRFAANFLTHLRTSIIGWLTGAMSGANIYVPQAFTILEIVKFVLSVLGLTWQNIRQKLVRAIGETAVRVLETGFDIVMTLVTQGPAAAWERIRESLTNLREMVMEQVMTFVRERIVQAAITRLVTSLNPAGAFIQAIIAIYNTIMFFIERLRQIGQVAMAFIDSISAIASGVLDAAANRVERTMGGMLTLVISFLARLIGLGRVSDAVIGVVNRVRAPIDRALDRVVDWIVARGRAFVQRAQGGTPEQRLERGLAAGQAVLDRFASRPVGSLVLRPLLAAIRVRYQLASLEPVEVDGYWAVEGVVNPRRRTPRSRAMAEGGRIGGIDPEPTAVLQRPVVRLRFTVMTRNFEMDHSLQRHYYPLLSADVNSEARNSLMHNSIPIDAPTQDAIALGRTLQAVVRRSPGSQPVGSYAVNRRNYLVDRPNHFFVVGGDQVWGGMTQPQWLAARALRVLELTGINPARLRNMAPARLVEIYRLAGRQNMESLTTEVNEAVTTIGQAREFLRLAAVSGRQDLVAAIMDIVRPPVIRINLSGIPTGQRQAQMVRILGLPDMAAARIDAALLANPGDAFSAMIAHYRTGSYRHPFSGALKQMAPGELESDIRLMTREVYGYRVELR